MSVIDMSKGMGENGTKPSLQVKSNPQLMTFERGRISVHRNEPSSELLNMEWSALKMYTHEQQEMSSVGCISVFIHTCVYVCAAITEGKDAINFIRGSDIG